MAEPPSLVPADYVVIACMLAVSLGVGIFLAIQRRKKTSKEDYLLGNRQLNVFAVTLSMFVTFQSSSSLIGVPAEVYTTGSDIALVCAGTGLANLLAIFTVIPIMHPLKVTSLYEYFQLRFESYALRLFVTCVGMFQKILFAAVVLLSPALSVQTATGLPFWMSVVIVGVVGIIYTSIGGIRGVVIVDAFQAVIIMIGILAVLIKGVNEIGDLETAWSIAKEGNRVQPVDIDPDPRVRHSVWALVIGAIFTFYSYSFDQSAIQRVCSVRTMAGARIVYAVNIPLVGIYWVSLSLMGIVAYSYFVTEGCDPFTSGTVNNRNQLMPFFVMKLFKDLPGMTGLYLATIFSGALSTVSSIINGLAANTVEDILKFPLMKCNATESVKLLTAKLSVCFYGGLCIGLAFLARNLTGTVIQTAMGLVGAFGGPVAGVFFLGALVPWANKIGATLGLLVSLILNAWLTLGAVLYGQRAAQLPPVPGNSCVAFDIRNETFSTSTTLSTVITTPLSDVSVPDRTVYDISYQYYGLTGWLVAFIVGLLVSIISYKWCQPLLEETLFFPCVRKFWNLKNSYTVTTTTDEKKTDLTMDAIRTQDNFDVNKTTKT